jgi:hypothetical protein
MLSMLFPTFIAAIFYEVASIAFLEFDAVHSCDAAVCANIVVAFSSAAHYLTINPKSNKIEYCLMIATKRRKLIA